jgi:hypothetical protein
VQNKLSTPLAYDNKDSSIIVEMILTENKCLRGKSRLEISRAARFTDAIRQITHDVKSRLERPVK